MRSNLVRNLLTRLQCSHAICLSTTCVCTVHHLIGSGVLAIHAYLGYMHMMSLHMPNAHVAHCTLRVLPHVLAGTMPWHAAALMHGLLTDGSDSCRFGPGRFRHALVLCCLFCVGHLCRPYNTIGSTATQLRHTTQTTTTIRPDTSRACIPPTSPFYKGHSCFVLGLVAGS